MEIFSIEVISPLKKINKKGLYVWERQLRIRRWDLRLKSWVWVPVLLLICRIPTDKSLDLGCSLGSIVPVTSLSWGIWISKSGGISTAYYTILRSKALFLNPNITVFISEFRWTVVKSYPAVVSMMWILAFRLELLLRWVVVSEHPSLNICFNQV